MNPRLHSVPDKTFLKFSQAVKSEFVKLFKQNFAAPKDAYIPFGTTYDKLLSRHEAHHAIGADSSGKEEKRPRAYQDQNEFCVGEVSCCRGAICVTVLKVVDD